MHSASLDDGSGVPYQIEYALRPATGRRPDLDRGHRPLVRRPGRAPAARPRRGARGQRAPRARAAPRLSLALRCADRRDEPLAPAPRCSTPRSRRPSSCVRSCGFLLVAIDNLGRINEAYGFDVADEVIAAVAKRMRAKLRGGDLLGRFSGNKFGIILKNCTPDDMPIAADRLLAGVRDEVVETGGGAGRGDGDDRRRHRAAPRPQRPRSPGARAGGARQRQGQAPRLVSRLSAERRARGAAARERARDRRDRHRAQRAPHPPGLRAGGRHRLAPAGVLRMPDAGQARRRHAAGGERGGADRRAARPRAPARSSRARARRAGADRGAEPAGEPQRIGGLDRRSRLVGGARSDAQGAHGSRQAADHRDHRDRRRSRTSTTPAASSRA